MAMSHTLLNDCRQRLKMLLGVDAAGKATDEFCLAFGAPLNRPRAIKAVIELVPQPWPLPPFQESVERLRNSTDFDLAHEAARAALREVAPQNLVPGTATLFNPVEALRDIYVHTLRNQTYQVALPIAHELEHSATGGGLVGASTRICWVNDSLGTRTTPTALAEVAAHPEVMRIDIARRLVAEIGRTGTVVGAKQHRSSCGHTGLGVTVAVIDYEIDQSHKAFQHRVDRTKNLTAEDWNNPSEHATAVAGIIGANGCLVGMAPDVRIQNYKISMTHQVTSPNDLQGALALEHALHNHARVANCSWKSDAPTDGTSREARACNKVWECGMTVVKSAGNFGVMTCPADADGVIVVGATDREGKSVQPYSGRGPTLNGKRPHMVAPGGTAGHGGRGIDSCLYGDFDDCGWGTSLSAAHVTGLLAVLLQKEPGLTPNEQRDRLLKMCTSLGSIPEAEGRGLVSIEHLCNG